MCTNITTIHLQLNYTSFMVKGFPCGSAGKESACNVRDLGLIPGLGRSPGEGKGYSLQYSGLENSMDCIVHRVTKSWTKLSDFHSLMVKCGYFRQFNKGKYELRDLLISLHREYYRSGIFHSLKGFTGFHL